MKTNSSSLLSKAWSYEDCGFQTLQSTMLISVQSIDGSPTEPLKFARRARARARAKILKSVPEGSVEDFFPRPFIILRLNRAVMTTASIVADEASNTEVTQAGITGALCAVQILYLNVGDTVVDPINSPCGRVHDRQLATDDEPSAEGWPKQTAPTLFQQNTQAPKH